MLDGAQQRGICFGGTVVKGRAPSYQDLHGSESHLSFTRLYRMHPRPVRHPDRLAAHQIKSCLPGRLATPVFTRNAAHLAHAYDGCGCLRCRCGIRPSHQDRDLATQLAGCLHRGQGRCRELACMVLCHYQAASGGLRRIQLTYE